MPPPRQPRPPNRTDPEPLSDDPKDKLKAKLRELFQLNRGDLDFGLYRIMALKTAEVTDFIDNHLIPQVTEALGDIAKSDSSILQKQLDYTRRTAEEIGVSPASAPKFKKLSAQLTAAKNDEHIVADTYNHLCNFFSRYYHEGDFMSLRRYKRAGKEAYAIPYNGEEVMLHWANRDQYYVKTTDNYSSYIFRPNKTNTESTVRFQIASADNEKDNIKPTHGNHRFFILAKNPITIKDDLLTVRFDHRPLTAGEKTRHPGNSTRCQASLNHTSETRITASLKNHPPAWLTSLTKPCPTDADPTRTVLAKHLTTYTAKNSFDYFIHKGLGNFLRRELDYYLKTEVLSIDNLELTDDPIFFIRSLQQIKSLKLVGTKIITLLAQLEDFQKQLWLKKKMVLETHYCVTLDKIPESLYPEIIKNKPQHKEWLNLYTINELNGDLASPAAYSKKLTPAFLKQNQYLVLDTKHFDQGFIDKLLSALSDTAPIDQQLNGLLVHGENFQALNLLQERYREQIKCIYIDPPYNSPSSEILYKNNYKHSSWMSLMFDRIVESKKLLDPTGVMTIAIDENEQYRLAAMLDTMFSSEHEINTLSIRHNPKGIQGGYISINNEYAIIISPPNQKGNPKPILREDWAYNNFRNWGGESERNTSKNCFYPVLVKNGEIVGFGDVCSNNEHPPVNVDMGDGVVAVYPVDNEKIERKWTYARNSVEAVRHLLRVKKQSNNHVDIEKCRDRERYKTVWLDTAYIAGDYGSKVLNNIIGAKKFDYPKSVQTVVDTIKLTSDSNSTILDHFAGSGTTGHAVINLNRENGSNRKYILAEIGHHFDDVLLPRLKKVIYSKYWKDGKPKDRQGISQLFRYIRLESYEDTMDSLQVTPRNALPEKWKNKKLVEDYHLRYALGSETSENASLAGKHFINPSQYTLSVVRDGIQREAVVDLAETFNLLLGLRLTSRRRIDGILTITGTTPRDETCLILWRDTQKTTAPKLEKWFTKHRKTLGNAFTRIYVNGDNTLNTRKTPTDKWEVVTTEPVFRELMFEANNE